MLSSGPKPARQLPVLAKISFPASKKLLGDPRYFGGIAMNHRILMALTLAGALAVPALAQQASGSQSQSNPPAATDQAQPQSNPPAATTDQSQPQSSSQPAAASTSANSQPKSADQLQPLTYEKHEGFWGHLNPFARKKYVQRQLNPMSSPPATPSWSKTWTRARRKASAWLRPRPMRLTSTR